MVEPDRGIGRPDHLQQRGRTDRREAGRLNRVIPRGRHERRRSQVVHLVGARRFQGRGERGLVEEVGFEELDPVRDRREVLVRRRARSNDSDDRIVPLEQELRQI